MAGALPLAFAYKPKTSWRSWSAALASQEGWARRDGGERQTTR
jgi:hypothetical protein